MNKNLFIILAVVTLFSSTVQSQSLEYYKPIGFNNPLLKSGQFISAFYYWGDKAKYSWDPNESQKNCNYSFNFENYIGLTDRATLSMNFLIYPRQTIFEQTGSLMRKDQQSFTFSPEITLSYRPINNLEIFGNIFYYDAKRIYGPLTRFIYVPVLDPDIGDTIYEKINITQEPASDLKFTNTRVRIGISYIGKLW